MSESEIRNYYAVLDEIDPSTVNGTLNIFDKKRSLVTEWSFNSNIWILVSKEEKEVKLQDLDAEYSFSYNAK